MAGRDGRVCFDLQGTLWDAFAVIGGRLLPTDNDYGKSIRFQNMLLQVLRYVLTK